SLSVQYGTTPSNSNTSIQRPLAHHRVMLSRRVIAYYGLIRDSESLPATYEFAAESAAPKENGLRWESRGSPIYSVGLGVIRRDRNGDAARLRGTETGTQLDYRCVARLDPPSCSLRPVVPVYPSCWCVA